jgi:hypothetical protein
MCATPWRQIYTWSDMPLKLDGLLLFLYLEQLRNFLDSPDGVQMDMTQEKIRAS